MSKHEKGKYSCGGHYQIPEGTTTIGESAFSLCTIPPNVTVIPFGLFWRCSNLTSVTLPDGIKRIGNYAFAGCTKLTLPAFPEKLTTIGAYAFKDCKSLGNDALPESVNTVGRGAFRQAVAGVEALPDDGRHYHPAASLR